MDVSFLELARQGTSILKSHLDKQAVIDAVCIDNNTTLSALSASIAAVSITGGADSVDAAVYTKTIMSLVFYLGYLEGKNSPDLSLWEEQLSEDNND